MPILDYANEPPLPHDRWGEEGLLGILICCPERLVQMPRELGDAWWDTEHRQLYACLQHLGAAATPSNLVLALAPDKPDKQVDWLVLIYRCIHATPFFSEEHISVYANWIVELADRRRRSVRAFVLEAQG